MAEATTPREEEEPADLPPLRSPFNDGGLLEVFRQRYVLRLLVRREISSRYQGSAFGLAWSYIQPMIRFAIFFFIIGTIIGSGRDVDVFGIHLFAGMVLVHFFTETFNAGTHSLNANKALVRKMPMPREMFPVASMLVSLYHTGPAMVVLLAAITVLGWSPDPVGLGAAALGFGMILLLASALSLLFSAANVFFNDFGKLVMTLTQFVTFSVPMIYPYTMVEDRFGQDFPFIVDFYLFNPVAEAVLLMQRGFWVGTTGDSATIQANIAKHFPEDLYTRGFVMLGISVVALVVAQWVFSRLDNKMPERL